MRLTVREITMVSLFAAFAVAAALMLRFGGAAVVPYSLMPLVVMLAGSLLNGRLAALSMGVYVLMGLVGLPVFAKPPFGGLSYVLQPSFGFLPGFIAGAYVIGKILERKSQRRFIDYLAACLAGQVVIYLVGLPYMYFILNMYLGKAVTFWEAFKIGVLPFILFDMAKGFVTAIVARPIARQVQLISPQRQ